MATVHEKIQISFSMKLLGQFERNFIASIYMMIIQNIEKKSWWEIQDSRHAHLQ